MHSLKDLPKWVSPKSMARLKFHGGRWWKQTALREVTHAGNGVFQEVLDKLELWDKAMQEAAKDVEQKLDLHGVVSGGETNLF